MRSALLAVITLLVLATGVLKADVIRLRTGEAVKGRPIQERSDESQITIEDYLTGALRRFAWEAVDPTDRERIRVSWGLENEAQGSLTGHRVITRLLGGDTEEVVGLVEQDDGSGPVLLRRGGTVLKIPRAQVVAVEEEEVDARQIWSAEQLHERLVEKMRNDEGVDFDNLTSRDHWRLATNAEWAGALEQAEEHYGACAADEAYLKRDMARQRLARVSDLLQDQAALGTLKAAAMKLQMGRFDRARDFLESFPELHPEASEGVLQRLETMRGQLVQKRAEYFRTTARRNFVKIVEKLIEDKVREDEIEVQDVTAWTRRGLVEEAFQALAEKKMAKRDKTVTPEEARTFWEGRMEGRTKPRWQKVSYGAGTFIVDPPKIKPPKRKRGGKRSRGGSKGGGAAAPIQIPKPPTRDQWWDKASSKDRARWVLAYFVEQSELFELGEREHRPCRVCNGVGLLSETYQTGDTVSFLCTRCGGAQQDVIIKYR